MKPVRYEQHVARQSRILSFNSFVWALPNLDVEVDAIRKHFLTRSDDNDLLSNCKLSSPAWHRALPSITRDDNRHTRQEARLQCEQRIAWAQLDPLIFALDPGNGMPKTVGDSRVAMKLIHSHDDGANESRLLSSRRARLAL